MPGLIDWACFSRDAAWCRRARSSSKGSAKCPSVRECRLSFQHSCYGRSVPELYPFLAVQDVAGAVDFYARAFDAVEEEERLIAPDGRQVAVVQIAGQHLGIAIEAPELGTPSPETAGATTVRRSLHVDNPDAAYAQAVAAGATEMFPVTDQPYGMRQGRVVDPFGHHWLIGKRL
jgi:PhnB protein